ncbi:MAG: glycosyltransferase family 4 protein [Bacteroidaceae bacterium]|nr:glycosyltransferase family 4 protein [Bacteroidaceae bacterium]
MKLIYCIRATYNPGGMERVLLNKVSYLVREKGWNVTIVTTDQRGRPPFYPFPEEIRMIDLGINYADDNEKNVLLKINGYLKRRKVHKRKLAALLDKERVDIVVSLYPSESSFIPELKDGSKKVLELHFCKFFRLQYGRNGLLGLIDRLRTKQDEKIARRFDKFVVLTNEDKEYWGAMPNIEVIPNAAMPMGNNLSDGSAKRVIAVGRLDYQKGFDRLIQAWGIVQQHETFKDWTLDIFGQGEWKKMLQNMIDKAELNKHTHINKPTNAIGKEYANSSLIVMTSNYEGFGMVLVEAMACGVPAIAFDCKCGPKDIIKNGTNGLLIANGDINGLAEAMMKLMSDRDYRKFLSGNAHRVTATYSEEAVMNQWINLFTSLTEQ